MDKRYGGRHKVAEGQYLSLSSVQFKCWSETRKVYHNDYETVHHFDGEIKVDASFPQISMKPFGRVAHHTPGSTQFSMRLQELPEHIREKMKALWLEIEEELSRSGVNNG